MQAKTLEIPEVISKIRQSVKIRFIMDYKDLSFLVNVGKSRFDKMIKLHWSNKYRVSFFILIKSNHKNSV